MRRVVMLGVTQLKYFRVKWCVLKLCMIATKNMNDVKNLCSPASRFVVQVHLMMEELNKHHFDAGFTALEYF